ncbi:prtrc system protein e [Fluviicola sp.]|uniref:prtrc system protein e n=1 Tax=Fluviicola sp. TaxID=1917219 RepID=UPI0031D04D96
MEETKFFEQIADIEFEGNICMAIAKDGEGGMVVSIMLQNEQCRDKAKKKLIPLLFKGSPQEIDEAFFDRIKAPIEKTSTMLNNMAEYMKSVEVVGNQSAMSKGRTEKQKSQKSDRISGFEEAMAKADELDRDNKPKDAWMLLDRLKGYPEHAETIRQRKRELSDKFSPPDLFNAPVHKDSPESSGTAPAVSGREQDDHLIVGDEEELEEEF